MHDDTLRRRFARAMGRMGPLQREITAGLLSDEDDDRIAERHGTTSGAVRIERAQARRFLRELLMRDRDR